MAAYLAMREHPELACRCGGPNSSHTVSFRGRIQKLRMMPAAAVIDPNVTVVFGAGTLIHIQTLLDECTALKFRGRLIISPNVGIIDNALVSRQRADPRYDQIGSTLTGTGYAAAERSPTPARSRHSGNTRAHCRCSAVLVRNYSKGGKILIEGHQGYGLSNYHGDYPYSSSRDCLAAELLSELGLGPIQHIV